MPKVDAITLQTKRPSYCQSYRY